MKRKKPDDEHENLERWLITYADLITLLLAFFIMMYTFSKQDAQRYQEVTEYLRAIFKGGSGVMSAGGGAAASTTMINALPKHGGGSEVQREEVRKQLEQEVKKLTENTEHKNKISVFQDERGIVLRIMDRAFFDEGKADLKDSAKKALQKIAPIIANSNSEIRIEGHTDDVPIHTSEFRSNWELSTRRATEVVRHLIEKYDYPSQEISASGYAEYRPIAGNDTAANRALNRRIEIILVKASKPEAPAAIAEAPPVAVSAVPQPKPALPLKPVVPAAMPQAKPAAVPAMPQAEQAMIRVTPQGQQGAIRVTPQALPGLLSGKQAVPAAVPTTAAPFNTGQK
jgi:chemotaxis protein MotB